jgi:hypothetical protein
MGDKVRKAGVYLASANWEKLAYLAIAAVAAWHYIGPLLATVVVPALLHHVYQARVLGLHALAEAAYREWLKLQGTSQEQAEKWVEEEEAEAK